MDSCVSLPYMAAPELLPEPLPTIEDIAASKDILKERSGLRVVRIGTHFIVKYGVHVHLLEGENMLYVKHFMPTFVPTIYAIHSHQPEGKGSPINYIIKENILGRPLSSCWSSLDREEKARIACELRNHMNRLRQIPSPGYFGSIGKRPFSNDAAFWTIYHIEQCPPMGPFYTAKQMLQAIAEDVRNMRQDLEAGRFMHEFYERVFPIVLDSQTSVFTHGDLQRKNIVIADDGAVVIIDWEVAGWYPVYFEYCLAMSASYFMDDWHSWIPQILDEYLNEFPWIKMHFRTRIF
ncbi:phosphotransferase enzyme family protein [Verticillium dahliae VdLs.17]|uniref:Phosphotransferase enzyme family protein n=1 Tax=Verticillium dahliae (strain VdLs.17 / ATCC MYA-4575 / FGSC 10137) TaxID=498257 RepID=G2X0N5_VERDV|nr:phosphotransferase enzyme family protein [Verticillium dahliae VdLs.17]EGY22376.1 phosphotransferase enzyme family protein [Verticillium dahliae VdLs.17]KAH6704781.1 phosphotransferase enzyme family protein [Verticillium dahliae]